MPYRSPAARGFAPGNQYRYIHFSMMKIRSKGFNGPERDEPGWLPIVKRLERRLLNQRVEVEIHPFDHYIKRIITRVYELGVDQFAAAAPARRSVDLLLPGGSVRRRRVVHL